MQIARFVISSYSLILEHKENSTSALFKQVPAASIVFFRISFGLIMLWDVIRLYNKGVIEKIWTDPRFHFTYYGFEWIQPWSGDGMYIHFFILGLLCVFIVIGLFYRVSILLFFLGFTYLFLLEKAFFLNHNYLICLISFILIFIPANCAFSLDSYINPKIKSNTLPSWNLWLIRFQIGIPYFFGGVAKIDSDWLRVEEMIFCLFSVEVIRYGPIMSAWGGDLGQDSAQTQLNSSLIASWRSNAEQTQAQSGSEPK